MPIPLKQISSLTRDLKPAILPAGQSVVSAISASTVATLTLDLMRRSSGEDLPFRTTAGLQWIFANDIVDHSFDNSLGNFYQVPQSQFKRGEVSVTVDGELPVTDIVLFGRSPFHTPDAGSTLLLFGLGLTALIYVRRKSVLMVRRANFNDVSAIHLSCRRRLRGGDKVI